jgi:sugar lactone lactonase YvrE
MTLRPSIGAALAAGLLAVSTLSAAPGFWQVATQADFLRGDVDQLSIDEHGRLTLGPELTRVHAAGVPFVWAALAMADGALFLGTGNDGKVIRVDRAGQGSVFFDSTEMEVHALAAAPAGAIYVGTSPDGRVYKVDAKGQATTFFDPDDKYIWSLAVDRQGNLFVATGDKGTIYKVSPEGKGDRFFATKAMHAIALTFDSNNQLLAGTGSPGRVFRIDPAGKGFLLLDTTYQEVRAVRVDAKGTIYAAAQSARAAGGGSDDRPDPTPPPPVAPTIPNVSTEVTSFVVVDAPSSSSQSSGASGGAAGRGPAGAVYRVQPDGLWDELWASRDDAPYDVAIEPDGALLVATGAKGKMFRLAGDPVRAVLLTRVPAQQATMIVRATDRTFVTTANPGLLMSLSSSRATRGTYESDVKDARFVSTWGVLAWKATVPAGAKVDIFSRSGNTRTPDDAWSEWAGPYASADGSPITSPKARYLQWRAVLTGSTASPVLTSVSAAFLPRNIRPQVTSITVHPPGVAFQKPFSSGETEIAGLEDDTPDRRAGAAGAPGPGGGAPALGRRTYQKGLQTFVWKADDENGDELIHNVFYRREGETTWHVLKEDLRDTLYVWDTSSVPNGTYVLKVQASDRKANAAEVALAGELESSSFEIDNVAPTVTVGAVRRDGTRFVVPVTARDGDSPVSRVEFSLDAQRWQAAFPRDGILDGRQELFEIRLDADADGRTIVVRATDALGNVGTGQAVVREPGR